jgi:hypothetical protein
VKIGRGVRQGCCLSPILFNLYSEYLTKEALEGFGDFKIGGQVIRTVKYADNLVLLAREENVLQGMVDRLSEIGRRYGMEMNVEKNLVMIISRQPAPMKIVIAQKQLENLEYFNYLGSMITNYARCTGEIKSRIAMPSSIEQEEENFHQQTELKFKEETSKVLHLEHCFVWC